MGNEPLGVSVEDGIVLGELGLQVVGIQDGDGGDVFEVGSEQGNVAVGNGDETAAAVGGRGDCEEVVGVLLRVQSVFDFVVVEMLGEIGGQVLSDSDWSHSGSAAAVGTGEGLVEVEVGDVCA